jgi:hypothetical protein
MIEHIDVDTIISHDFIFINTSMGFFYKYLDIK